MRTNDTSRFVVHEAYHISIVVFIEREIPPTFIVDEFLTHEVTVIILF